MSTSPQKTFRIAPLQKPFLRRLFQLMLALMFVWGVVFLSVNDSRLARLVSQTVSQDIYGKLQVDSIHYSYWSSFASLIFNTPALVQVKGVKLYDPQGVETITIDKFNAKFYVGRLIRSLVKRQIFDIWKRPSVLELNVSSGEVLGARVFLTPLEPAQSKLERKIVMNVIAAMTSNKKSQSPHRSTRIVFENEGVTVKQSILSMEYENVGLNINKLDGAIVLRYSSAALENKPGNPAFTFELAPLIGSDGELRIKRKGQKVIKFPIDQVKFQRFGSRPSRSYDLSVRGGFRSKDANFEVDGHLQDAYCDPVFDLRVSFAQLNQLLVDLTGNLLQGAVEGQVSLLGTLLSNQPQSGDKIDECVAQMERERIGVGRGVLIDGELENLEIFWNELHFKQGKAKFHYQPGRLTFLDLQSSILGGTFKAIPLSMDFENPAGVSLNGQVSFKNLKLNQWSMFPTIMKGLFSGEVYMTSRLKGVIGNKNSWYQLDGVDGRFYPDGKKAKMFQLLGGLGLKKSVLSISTTRICEGLCPVQDSAPSEMGIQEGEVDFAAKTLDLKGLQIRADSEFALRLIAPFSLGQKIGVRQVLGSIHQISGSIYRPDVIGGRVQLIDTAGILTKPVQFSIPSFELVRGVAYATFYAVTSKEPTKATGSGTLDLFKKGWRNPSKNPYFSLDFSWDNLDLTKIDTLIGTGLQGVSSGYVKLSESILRPMGKIEVKVPLLSWEGMNLQQIALEASLGPKLIQIFSIRDIQLGNGAIGLNSSTQRDGLKEINVDTKLKKISISDLPFVGRLPFNIKGFIDGEIQAKNKQAFVFAPELSGYINFSPVQFLAKQDGLPLVQSAYGYLSKIDLASSQVNFTSDLGMTYVKGLLFGVFPFAGQFGMVNGFIQGEVSLDLKCKKNIEKNQLCELIIDQAFADLFKLLPTGVQSTAQGELKLSFTDIQDLRTYKLKVHLEHFLVTIPWMNDDGKTIEFQLINQNPIDVMASLDGVEFVKTELALSRKIDNQKNLVGQVSLEGVLRPTDSNLHIAASNIQLEILEPWLRNRLDNISGQATIDIVLQKEWTHPIPAGKVVFNNIAITPFRWDSAVLVEKALIQLSAVQDKLLIGPSDIFFHVGQFITKVSGTVVVSRTYGEILSSQMSISGEIPGRTIGDLFPNTFGGSDGKVVIKEPLEFFYDKGGFFVNGRVTPNLKLNFGRYELDVEGGDIVIQTDKKTKKASFWLGCPENITLTCSWLSVRVDESGIGAMRGRLEFDELLLFGRQVLWHQLLHQLEIQLKFNDFRYIDGSRLFAELSSDRILIQLVSEPQKHLVVTGSVDVTRAKYREDFYLIGGNSLIPQAPVIEDIPIWKLDPFWKQTEINFPVKIKGPVDIQTNIASLQLASPDFYVGGTLAELEYAGTVYARDGIFSPPGINRPFFIKPDKSYLRFGRGKKWPETPYIEIHGVNSEPSSINNENRIEMTILGTPLALSINCLSSSGKTGTDCLADAVMGGAVDQSGATAAALAGNLVVGTLLDPLKQALSLDTVALGVGIGNLDLRICKTFVFFRICGVTEFGRSLSGSIESTKFRPFFIGGSFFQGDQQYFVTTQNFLRAYLGYRYVLP